MALRLHVKPLPLKILFGLMPEVPLVESHSLPQNFLLPDVFLKRSNFHESDVVSLSYDFPLSLASWNEQTNKQLWKSKLI